MPQPSDSLLGRLSLLLVVVGCMTGCPAPSQESSAPAPSAPSATSTDAAHQDAAHNDATVGPGWPVGDDPQASADQLAAKVHDYFASHTGTRYADIYPRGWSRVRWEPQSAATATLHAPNENKPRTAEVQIVLLKKFSVLHESAEEAAADEKLFAFNPAPTIEAMHAGVNPATKPVTLTIEYVDDNGTWRRHSWQTVPLGKEPRTWFDELAEFP